VVEHCVGPLGLGTLIVKPERHVTAVADLNDAEAAELGPLLRLAARVATVLVDADQVYTCLWSHAGAVPGHVHYVVQPVTAEQVAETGLHGPALQMQLFRDNQAPPESSVAELAERARALFAAFQELVPAGVRVPRVS
jgi:diadenosine tetraphosphate (Ap4A) HIT family hydrolase